MLESGSPFISLPRYQDEISVAGYSFNNMRLARPLEWQKAGHTKDIPGEKKKRKKKTSRCLPGVDSELIKVEYLKVQRGAYYLLRGLVGSRKVAGLLYHGR
jgi:hypothetical protein